MQTLQLSWPVQSIERAVAALWPGLAAEVLTQVDSTNTLLLERARAGLVQPTLVVAERQTAGRGRMGRQWVSHQPVGGSLTFSLSLPLGEGIFRACRWWRATAWRRRWICSTGTSCA